MLDAGDLDLELTEAYVAVASRYANVDLTPIGEAILRICMNFSRFSQNPIPVDDMIRVYFQDNTETLVQIIHVAAEFQFIYTKLQIMLGIKYQTDDDPSAAHQTSSDKIEGNELTIKLDNFTYQVKLGARKLDVSLYANIMNYERRSLFFERHFKTSMYDCAVVSIMYLFIIYDHITEFNNFTFFYSYIICI